jgi:hypothetical protein
MKQYRLQLLAACLLSVGFFALLGWAGDIDYCDQVILNMSQDEYDNVKDTLTKKFGKSPSEREIAHWWADHRNRAE